MALSQNFELVRVTRGRSVSLASDELRILDRNPKAPHGCVKDPSVFGRLLAVSKVCIFTNQSSVRAVPIGVANNNKSEQDSLIAS